MTDRGEWLVEFSRRLDSGAFHQNFLWRTGTVYIMDNHRAALWCWMQHVNPEAPHSLFHIDRHYDTLQSQMKTWLPHFPKRWEMNIKEYLELSYTSKDAPSRHHLLFSFDNYLSLYLHKFKKHLKNCEFATHEHGDTPNCRFTETPPWKLLPNMDYWIENAGSPWILNIDLDYFFCDGGDDERRQMLSDEYIRSLFLAARNVIEGKQVAVTTIALSPGWCGGWENSERVLSIAMNALGIKFNLPAA